MNQVCAKELHEEIMKQDNDEMVEFISSKFAELYSEVERLNKKVERLSFSFEQSELLFSLPEVELLSRSKLNRVVIHASDPVSLESNMYQLEENSGTPYRWLGPKRLTKFTVPIERSQKKTVILSLLSQISDGFYGSLKLYVDGELLPHEVELSNGSAKVYANLPESNRVQDTVVALFCPEVFRPIDLDSETSDTRQLSVSFFQLEII